MSNSVITGDLLMDAQLLIEKRMRDAGVERSANQLGKQQAQRGESGTQYGQAMLTHGLAKFAAGISEEMEAPVGRGGRAGSARKLLAGGDANVIAFVFMKFIINGISVTD